MGEARDTSATLPDEPAKPSVDQGAALEAVNDGVTEVHRLEDALRRSLAQRDEHAFWLKATQRVAKLGHYDYDLRVDRWESSEQLDSIFGIAAGSPRTLASWVSLVHRDEQAGMAAYFAQLATSGTRFDRVYRLATPEGAEPRWAHGLGELERDAGGAPLRLVGTIQDITEQHLAQAANERLAEMLRQGQKLESIGRLAGGVAHDFNNLLTVIFTCTDGLRASFEARGLIDPEDLEELELASRRAQELTGQLLAFARKRVVDAVVLELNDELHGSERLLRRLIGEDVQLVLELQAELPPVLFDPSQLQQVLLNLAANARDAMPRGGQLTISTSSVDDAPAAEEGWLGQAPRRGPSVRVLVTDTGTGIAPEIRGRLFEPFATTKSPGRGTGLGLATAHGLINQAQGTLRFRTGEGRGTTFELLLPPAGRGERAVQAPAPLPVHAGRASARVLVVEDDPAVRALTTRVLRHQGYEVLEAANGAEALALVRQGPPPALLLTDVVMPGMTGREVAEAARASSPSLRVLYMSGYADDIVVHHGVVDEGVLLLHKPFTSAALLDRVRAALDAR